MVDTVGAGDAFVGGFVVGWMEGMGALEAARFAAAVAAISVGRPGAQDAMPWRGEVGLAVSMPLKAGKGSRGDAESRREKDTWLVSWAVTVW